MAKNQSSGDSTGQILELHGFDLMAQVESILRHTRHYQREVQRLRGMAPDGLGAESRRSPVDALEEHVRRMRAACATFSDALTEVESVLKQLGDRSPRAVRPDEQ